MRPISPLVPAAVPVLALVGGLPFVNRLEPFVLGLPFLLFWILAWVLATPAFLALAYLIARGQPPANEGAPPAPGRSVPVSGRRRDPS